MILVITGSKNDTNNYPLNSTIVDVHDKLDKLDNYNELLFWKNFDKEFDALIIDKGLTNWFTYNNIVDSKNIENTLLESFAKIDEVDVVSKPNGDINVEIKERPQIN